MTQTACCAEGTHELCSGSAAKWNADRDDVILGRTGEDRAGVLVACACPCHAKGGDRQT